MPRGPDHTDAAEWPVVLTPAERVAIRQGLAFLRRKLEKRLANFDRKGFQPEPGKEHVAVGRIRTIDGLIERIPRTEPLTADG
jgi:hypothetical protein